ncbi:biotin transport system ATP-binding protein [Gemmobacter caeni]|uniref:Biotin transport system ATP-binding protein n=1 Tax=Gemmobacter caeni TaxID=589035 RepID=A0A2T6BC17_9RHOB|nr:ABC transporter ATP-binding protein [Gemmobacter caeni]PTX53615.1 biotin transport system ATP-binding protein [Gemmobacter caeni]TWJ05726.1 biotin transport system ATP-binding protein [Gemmobacter caeni]
MDGIEFSGVQYAVQGKPVLHGITLSLHERRIGIVGRNGSGKTTLLRLMAGLLAPTGGTIRVAGVDPAVDRKAMLRAIGILFQNPDHQIIFPTVEEELAFGLRQLGLRAGEATARVRTCLAAEGRAHWAAAPVTALSQGQKQWLCLMAVLLMEPATLLLDEPFAALDLPTQARLSRRLASLPQRLVTISHDPQAVAGCDRVIWLEAGRVVGDGAAAWVLEEFRAEMARRGDSDADTDLGA